MMTQAQTRGHRPKSSLEVKNLRINIGRDVLCPFPQVPQLPWIVRKAGDGSSVALEMWKVRSRKIDESNGMLCVIQWPLL